MIASLPTLLAQVDTPEPSGQWGYVAAGWIIAFVVLAAYAFWTLRRGRVLSRELPPSERRWM